MQPRLEELDWGEPAVGRVWPDQGEAVLKLADERAWIAVPSSSSFALEIFHDEALDVVVTPPSCVRRETTAGATSRWWQPKTGSAPSKSA